MSADRVEELEAALKARDEVSHVLSCAHIRKLLFLRKLSENLQHDFQVWTHVGITLIYFQIYQPQRQL